MLTVALIHQCVCVRTCVRAYVRACVLYAYHACGFFEYFLNTGVRNQLENAIRFFQENFSGYKF